MCKDCNCTCRDKNGYSKFDKLTFLITVPLLSIALLGLIFSAIFDEPVVELVFAVIGYLAVICTVVLTYFRSIKRKNEIVRLQKEVDDLKKKLDEKK